MRVAMHYLLGISTLVAIATCLVCLGCKPQRMEDPLLEDVVPPSLEGLVPVPPSADWTPVSRRAIDKLRIGMDMREAMEALRPAWGFRGSCPIVAYADGKTGWYSLLFFDPKRAEEMSYPYALRAVIYSPPGSRNGTGRFILPKNKAGRRYDFWPSEQNVNAEADQK